MLKLRKMDLVMISVQSIFILITRSGAFLRFVLSISPFNFCTLGILLLLLFHPLLSFKRCFHDFLAMSFFLEQILVFVAQVEVLVDYRGEVGESGQIDN